MNPVGTLHQTTCHACGYQNAFGTQSCSMCSALVERGHDAKETEPEHATEPNAKAPWQGLDPAMGLRSYVSAPSSWWMRPSGILGAGAVFALAFLLPLVKFMGWFLASLVHESGHVVVSWFFGQPAFPAIRLDGHAVAVHHEQEPMLLLVVGLGLALLTFAARNVPKLCIALGALTLLYPLLALTEAQEFLHLMAGQGGELAFACLCFYRALSGGFTSSIAERFTYAACAWYLLGRNVVLSFGLMTSDAARTHYDGSGSFGLTNDLIRVARQIEWSLQSTAGILFLLCLITLPLALFIWSRTERGARSPRIR